METVAIVNDQYSVAAGEHVPMACCPGVGYEKQLLAAIPEVVLERDYGCGDPTPWVRPGETVLEPEVAVPTGEMQPFSCKGRCAPDCICYQTLEPSGVN